MVIVFIIYQKKKKTLAILEWVCEDNNSLRKNKLGSKLGKKMW